MENKINEIGRILADIQYDINIIKQNQDKLKQYMTQPTKLQFEREFNNIKKEQLLDWIENNFVKPFSGEIHGFDKEVQQIHKATSMFLTQKFCELQQLIDSDHACCRHCGHKEGTCNCDKQY